MIDNLALIAAAAGRTVLLTAQALAPVAVAALVALAVVLAARYLLAGHRAGTARLAAYDARTADARRRARLARRTIIDADTGAVTIEARRTR